MDTFRAFILDHKNRIVRAEVLQASTDEEAIAAARPFWEESALEVWKGNRRIGRILKGGERAPDPKNGGAQK